MNPINAIPGSDDVLRCTLHNQSVLLARENPLSPSVVISGYIPGGAILDPADRQGLALFLSLGLMRGTEHRNFQRMYQEIENCGASLSFNAGMHSIQFRGRMLAEDLPAMLEILYDVLRYPIFPKNHMIQIRDQLLAGLAIRAQDTEAMAEQAFDQALFGSHPYGRDKSGTPESIQAIDQTDLMRFHADTFRPEGMVLCVVGGIEPQKAADLFKAQFEQWQPAAVSEKAEAAVFPRVTAPERIERAHIEIPEKSQLDLVLGAISPERKAADYQAAVLGNCILGEFGMMGRIGKTVRDDNGLAYYAGSSVSGMPLGGSWEISAGVNPENLEKAIDLIRSEVRRFTTEPVDAEELDDVKSYTLGRMPLQLETNSGIAEQLLQIERYGLGLDYLRQYAGIIQSISREQILQTAAAYLDADQLVIGTAGTLAE